jgi:hypothetical protein
MRVQQNRAQQNPQHTFRTPADRVRRGVPICLTLSLW